MIGRAPHPHGMCIVEHRSHRRLLPLAASSISGLCCVLCRIGGVDVRASMSKPVVDGTGSIHLILGPMFAGKTTELMRRVRRFVYAQLNCCIIKYARDSRYSEHCVASHDKQLLKATISVSKLEALGDEWRQYDCIAIDEGQFFPDLAKFCNRAADSGKIVVVSALDGDYLRQPFGDIVHLIPCCESLQKLTAVCMMCHERDAHFTRRTVVSEQHELIGGAESYLAVCRKCYSVDLSDNTPQKRGYSHACKKIEELTRRSIDEEKAKAEDASGGSSDDAPDSTSKNRPKSEKKNVLIDEAKMEQSEPVAKSLTEAMNEEPLTSKTPSLERSPEQRHADPVATTP